MIRDPSSSTDVLELRFETALAAKWQILTEGLGPEGAEHMLKVAQSARQHAKQMAEDWAKGVLEENQKLTYDLQKLNEKEKDLEEWARKVSEENGKLRRDLEEMDERDCADLREIHYCTDRRDRRGR